MNDLQPLLDLLSGQFSWTSTLIAWVCALMTASRFVFKPFSARLAARMAEAAASADTEDDADWEKLLRSKVYRVAAFVLDLVFSVKLPTYGEFLKLKKQ